MNRYQKILVAVDLGESSDTVCARAADLAKVYAATVTLLHVVEYVPVEPMGEALLPTIEFSDELVASAEQRLGTIALRNGLGDAKREIRVGNIKSELIQVAGETDADLIILGSRERHGPAILVNYTEDTILHAAPCDLLAVRIK